MISAFQQHLQRYLDNVPIDNYKSENFEQNATQLIESSRALSSKDTLKSRWEIAIRAEVLSLTEQEQSYTKSQPDVFYGRMLNILDLTMLLSENDCTELGLPFNLVRELFECLSIPSCSHVFSWVERRGKRLCLDPKRAKGTGLLVLRTLNELLRNLSKSTETEFCARILVFMNDIFPLSERSAVNLRGEYGPMWEGPPDLEEGKTLILEEERRKEGIKDESGDIKMDEPEAEPTLEQKKTILYKTFWFLQYPFSKPAVFSEAEMFKAFQHSVNSVLPVLSEATKKERTLAGSKTVVGTKRKRNDAEGPTRSYPILEQHRDYAFAKYLSSPELLELEIADTNFRRQFLFQLLILLQHLRSFTEAEKAKWVELRNRSLHMDFTLSEAGENWVKEVNGKVMLELRSTVPEGRIFEEMVRVILEREQNWIRWKNALCQSFEKGPIPEDVEELMRAQMRELLTPPEEWPHSHGTRELSEIWVLGYRDPFDLEMPKPIPEVTTYVPLLQAIDKRMAARKAQLEKTMAPRPTPVDGMKIESEANKLPGTPTLHASLPPKPGTPSEGNKHATALSDPFAADKERIFQKDPRIQGFESQKQTLSWLALRSASRQYLHLFSKIGTGDVEKLAELVKAEEKGQTGPKQEDEAQDGLSEKGDGDNPDPDIEMKSEDIKIEEVKADETNTSIPVEDAAPAKMEEDHYSIAVDGNVEEILVMEEASSAPTNAMEVDSTMVVDQPAP